MLGPFFFIRFLMLAVNSPSPLLPQLYCRIQNSVRYNWDLIAFLLAEGASQNTARLQLCSPMNTKLRYANLQNQLHNTHLRASSLSWLQ